MKIAFVTTCKGRLCHLRETLPRNLRDNADFKNCVFVVLNYNDRDGLAHYIQHEHAAEIASGKLVYYRTNEPDRFHMANAKNMAHRCAIREGADVLVTLDADNLTGPKFASYIARQFAMNYGLSFMSPDFEALPPRGKRFNQHNPERLGRGFAGRLAIRAQDFIKIGGYNEIFDTWRGEDIDMIARLNRLGLKKTAIEPLYLNALAHSTEMRFSEYPEAIKYETDEIYELTRTAHDTVVNWGNAGCGTVFRNFKSTPIKLGRVPTRVFGIGMQRTGTSSLHEAFQTLGFDSMHWPSADWAQAVWQETNKWGRSGTLERSYAACDNPIPSLYQKLDKAYPGSKFVLTVRDENDWLASVEKFWTYEGNHQRWVWDVDKFTHRMHSIIYGQPTFDREVFRARYRKHNAEVMEYFDGRADLLRMDVAPDTPMDDLCGFLGVPPTGRKFPHSNKGHTP